MESTEVKSGFFPRRNHQSPSQEKSSYLAWFSWMMNQKKSCTESTLHYRQGSQESSARTLTFSKLHGPMGSHLHSKRANGATGYFGSLLHLRFPMADGITSRGKRRNSGHMKYDDEAFQTTSRNIDGVVFSHSKILKEVTLAQLDRLLNVAGDAKEMTSIENSLGPFDDKRHLIGREKITSRVSH